MKALGWSCVLGLLCMPAGVLLQEWTASQNPSSNHFVRINSSAEITCGTSLPEPLSLSVQRRFHSSNSVLFLSLDNGRIAKRTTAAEFAGRVLVSSVNPRGGERLGFTVRLSLLRKEDTNLYYCSWGYFDLRTEGILDSKGTAVIVRERGPEDDDCKLDTTHLAFICLITVATSAILSFSIGALIYKCTRFGKKFTPGRVAEPPRASRPLPVAPQQSGPHCPYVITAVNSPDLRHFP